MGALVVKQAYGGDMYVSVTAVLYSVIRCICIINIYAGWQLIPHKCAILQPVKLHIGS